MNKPLVSIIIPVYNVEKYLNRCLESVNKQTYDELQIILMEGKSTDNSLKIVKKWADIDRRVHIVSKRDGGLGSARNNGVAIANGKYIFFLDADDWLADETIERMIWVAESDSKIDYVQADVIFFRDGCYSISNADITLTFDCFFKKTGLMYIGYNHAWGKLFRTDFYKKNMFMQRNMPCEDLVIYPAIVASARKIVICNSAKVYYRVNREGSLSQIQLEYKSFPDIMLFAENELRRLGCYDSYGDVFRITMLRYFRMIIEHGIGEQGFYKLKENDPFMYEYGRKMFSCFSFHKCWVYGGFGLRWIAHRLPNGKDGVEYHFTFTSIIAQMSASVNKMKIKHNNKFRECALNNDYNGNALFDKSKAPQCILIDFSQECTDIGLLDDGNFITVSEALKESTFTLEHIKTIYCWKEQEFFSLWKEKCLEFIRKMESRFPDVKIIIVENYLSEFYRYKESVYKYDFPVYDINFVLSKMYSFFESNAKNVIPIKLHGVSNCTDFIEQKHSINPGYYNHYYYNYAAAKIFECTFMDYIDSN